MGRRKRKKEIKRRPVRRIPSIFLCPRCSRQALSISLKRKMGEDYAIAHAICGECGLCVVFKVPSLFQPVDAYGKLVDIHDRYMELVEEAVDKGDCFKEPGLGEVGEENIEAE